MSTCDYRVSIEQAGQNFTSGEAQGAIVRSARGNVPLCQELLDELDIAPFCYMPDSSTGDCPTGKERMDRLNQQITNAKLRQFFEDEVPH